MIFFLQGNVVQIKNIHNGEIVYQETQKIKIRVIYDFRKTLRPDEFAISTVVGLYFAEIKEDEETTI